MWLRLAFRMRWNSVGAVVFLWIYSMSLTRVDSIPFEIRWNKTNPIFDVSTRNNELQLREGDRLDIVCPYYPGGTAANMEYYIIYMVQSDNYKRCYINDTTKVTMLLNCSQPNSELGPQKFTIWIRAFQPFPGVPDFHAGESYYFISTSGGTKSEMKNQWKGACEKWNMKITLRVCCNGTETQKPFPTQTTRAGVTPSTPVTTPKMKTTTTTSTTTPAPTTTKIRTTTKTRPSYTDRIPRPNLPDENVIHADGPKNTGYISDNACSRTFTSWTLLVLSVTLAVLGR